MSFEVFLCPLGPRPLTSALPHPDDVGAWLTRLDHTTVLARWAAYTNHSTGAELHVDWSQSHICWVLPVCRTRAVAVEGSLLIERFCRDHGLRPLWWSADTARELDGLAAALVARWDATNEAARVALAVPAG